VDEFKEDLEDQPPLGTKKMTHIISPGFDQVIYKYHPRERETQKHIYRLLTEKRVFSRFFNRLNYNTFTLKPIHICQLILIIRPG
jgi:hypothetical protein